jgi:uncharacterized protein YegP (UPF0339 family)
MKIKIWNSKKGKEPWRWHFVGGNGEIVSPTEPRPTYAAAISSAKAAVKSIIKPRLHGAEGPELYITFEKKLNRDGSTTLKWSWEVDVVF